MVKASRHASIIFSLPVFLYPLFGWYTDRYGGHLFLMSACGWLTFFAYLILAIPSNVLSTPMPTIIMLAIAYGPAPLLLVLFVPLITKKVSIILGIHKTLENSGVILALLTSHMITQRPDDTTPEIIMFAVFTVFFIIFISSFWINNIKGLYIENIIEYEPLSNENLPQRSLREYPMLKVEWKNIRSLLLFFAILSAIIYYFVTLCIS